MKKVLSVILIISLFLGLVPVAYAEETSALNAWTETSYQNVFRDATQGSSQEINLVMAKNEYESAQIVLKSAESFTIQSVTFSNLVSDDESAVIPSTQISYNYVGYVYLPSGSSGINTSLRGEAGYYPEWLLNNATIEVSANEAQPIWLTVYTSPSQTPAAYSGTATVTTSIGTVIVDIEVEVCDVTIPNTDEAECNFYFWQANVGWYNKPRSEDQIEVFYGSEYTRYSEKWWELMDVFAESSRRNRNNYLMVPTVTLLFDGGTTVNETGTYTFNWSKFDQFIEFMLDRDWVKYLVGNQLAYRNNGWSSNYETYIIDRDETGTAIVSNVSIDSDATENWFSQFLPALQTHLASKTIEGTQTTWLDIWQQSIADEPYSQTNATNWVTLQSYVNTYAPQFFVQEAIQSASYNSNYVGKLDAWIVQLDVLENNSSFYNTQKQNGDQVWMYTCLSPKGNYLNRFIDQPVWMGRSLMWLVFQKGLDGYLHWGWNAWHYEIPRNPYGDTYSVWPDVERGTITETIRLAALRDGAEEYELLCQLSEDNPYVAEVLCDQVVITGTSYNNDPDSIQKIRDTLIRAAAGNISLTTELPVIEDFENTETNICQIVNGSWSNSTVDDNNVQMQTTTSSESIMLFGYSGWDDYAVQTDLAVTNWENGDAVGLLGRYQDANNYYLWRIGNVQGNNVLQLYKKVSGTFTKLYEHYETFDAFDINTLKLVMDGSTVKGYLNGVLKASIEDSSFSTGSAGVRGYATSYYIDNICITDVATDTLAQLPQSAVLDVDGDWGFESGSWSTQVIDESDTLYQSSTSGEALAVWGHPMWCDYSVTAEINVSQLNGDSSVGLIAGYVDSGNYYLWRVAQDSNNRTLLQLFKRENGSFVKLYEQATSSFVEQNVALGISVNGNTITAKLDEETVCTLVSTSTIRGSVGFRSLNSSFYVHGLSVTSSIP